MYTSSQWAQKLDRLHLLVPLQVLLIVSGAILATIFVPRLVSRLLRGVFERAASDDDYRAGARRKALSSSLAAAFVGVVWSIAVITVVGQLGINIGAFVAVATVIGGAVGFGAQVLVRDVIAGFFVLADDQFGPGDEIELGLVAGSVAVVGVVERVTLRTARVRDGEGTIWHIAHGSVLRVGNTSKSSTGPLDVEVSRSMDIDTLTAEVTLLALHLASNPIVAPMLAGEPRIVGIMDIQDDRILFRIRVPTQPGRLDDVRRVWRTLVLQAFATGRLVAPATEPNVLRLEMPAPTSESPETQQ